MIKLYGKRKITEDNLWNIITSFGYVQTVEEPENADCGKYFWFESGKAYCVQYGKVNEKSFADSASLGAEVAIMSDLENGLRINIGDSEIYDLLMMFGFEDFIEEKENYRGKFSVKYKDFTPAYGTLEDKKSICVIDMEQLEKAKEEFGEEVNNPASLIFAEEGAEAEAYEVALTLRINGCIIDWYNAESSIEKAEQYAKEKNMSCIIRVCGENKIKIKEFSDGSIIETTVSEFLGYYDEEEEHAHDCDCGHCH